MRDMDYPEQNKDDMESAKEEDDTSITDDTPAEQLNTP